MDAIDAALNGASVHADVQRQSTGRTPLTTGFVHALLDMTRLTLGAGAFFACAAARRIRRRDGTTTAHRDTSGERAVGVSGGAVDAWRFACHRPSLIAIVSIANRRPRGSRPSLIAVAGRRRPNANSAYDYRR